MPRHTARKSHLITPFGIGSILDLPNESLMLMGLDWWKTEYVNEVSDERLAGSLGVRTFYSPVEGKTYGAGNSHLNNFRGPMPYARFPTWSFCPNCREMKQMPMTKPYPVQHACPNKKGYQKTFIPVRFVLACDAGHVQDFPWFEWVHGSGAADDGREHKMKLLGGTGAGIGLGAVKVKCSCGKSRTLQGAGSPETLKKFTCTGNRPWLGPDSQEECSRPLMLVQRGATNLYFQDIVSSILVPPYSQRAYRLLQSPAVKREMEEIELVNGVPNPVIAEHYLRRISKKNAVSIELLQEAYQRIYTPEAADKTTQSVDEEQYRFEEYRAFTQQNSSSDNDLVVEHEDLSESSEAFSAHVEVLGKVEKLVETRALVSFTRVTPEGRKNELSKSKKDWLPAISGNGEGIFISLDMSKIEKWNTLSNVIKRVARIRAHAEQSKIASRRSGNEITPTFVMLHTLAHMLNRRLAFDCGYGSSSIKERIYESSKTDQPMAGILLYTASSGGDDTLGGLVAMAALNRFENVFQNTLNDCMLCSNDPLCSGSQGQGPNSVNLAACYGCALLPETSCEESNSFLDRGLLIGVQNDPEVGFFSDYLLSQE